MRYDYDVLHPVEYNSVIFYKIIFRIAKHQNTDMTLRIMSVASIWRHVNIASGLACQSNFLACSSETMLIAKSLVS